jgi:hypothetical protein
MKNTPLSSKDSKAFVKKLNILLKTTGLPKVQLAELGNTKQSTLKAWLLGRNRVTVEGQDNFEYAMEEWLQVIEDRADAIDTFLGGKTYDAGFTPVK